MVKVFVGNLSFMTTDAQLQEAFAPIGGVQSANIIRRGPRSLGYGFVEFDTQPNAESAVARMHKTQMDGREINVEVAKPRDESAVAKSEARPRARGRPARARADGAAPSTSTGGGAGAAAPSGERRRGAKKAAAGAEGGAGASGAAAAGGERQRRAPAPRQERPQNPSTKTLFVANLPFGLNEPELLAIFAGFEPSVAKVVRKPNGRSKGFGFVEFASAAAQQNALKCDKKTVDGREIAVKVAMTEPIIKDEAGPSKA